MRFPTPLVPLEAMLLIPLSYSKSFVPTSPGNLECGRTNLISIPTSSVAVGKKEVYFKNAGSSFPGIGMFSSLIFSFQAVEWCPGEIFSSPSVGTTWLLWSNCSFWRKRPKRGLSCRGGNSMFPGLLWKNILEEFEWEGWQVLWEKQCSGKVQMGNYTWVLHWNTSESVGSPMEKWNDYYSVYWNYFCSRATLGIFLFSVCLDWTAIAKGQA